MQKPIRAAKLQAPSSKLQAPSSKLQAVDDDGALILELQPRHISLAFRHFRLKQGLSQYKLEQLTPFSIHTICMRESVHYQNFPTVTTLYSYCDAYDITLTEFIACAFSFVTTDMTMI
ncbi:hypothetical protein [Sphaerochaeta sp.]|uniref:hypothetical protein n=1 Tax=Sphaerochaeta sp. TaxID=1972642 RepID=UPI002FC60843